MKLGFGPHRHMPTRKNFPFARQAGTPPGVGHLVDCFCVIRAGSKSLETPR